MRMRTTIILLQQRRSNLIQSLCHFLFHKIAILRNDVYTSFNSSFSSTITTLFLTLFAVQDNVVSESINNNIIITGADVPFIIGNGSLASTDEPKFITPVVDSFSSNLAQTDLVPHFYDSIILSLFLSLIVITVGLVLFVANYNHVLFSLIYMELVFLGIGTLFSTISVFIQDPKGIFVALFLLVVAAGESAIVLSLVVLKSKNSDDLSELDSLLKLRDTGSKNK